MNELIGLVVNFRAAGAAIFPVIGIGLLGAAGVIVGIVAAFAGKRSRSFTLGTSVALMAIGPVMAAVVAVARAHAWLEIGRALEHLNAVDQGTMMSAGWAQAEMLMLWAVSLSAIPVVLGVALFGLGLARRWADPRPAQA
jgi:hypothetical protein